MGGAKTEYYKKVQSLANKEYTGIWKETWAKFVYPIYPMSYDVFLRIKNKDLNGYMKGEYKEEFYKKVRELANKEYTGSWKETWAIYVCPVYPMSYVTFSRIMNNWKSKKTRRKEQA